MLIFRYVLLSSDEIPASIKTRTYNIYIGAINVDTGVMRQEVRMGS